MVVLIKRFIWKPFAWAKENRNGTFSLHSSLVILQNYPSTNNVHHKSINPACCSFISGSNYRPRKAIKSKPNIVISYIKFTRAVLNLNRHLLPSASTRPWSAHCSASKVEKEETHKETQTKKRNGISRANRRSAHGSLTWPKDFWNPA